MDILFHQALITKWKENFSNPKISSPAFSLETQQNTEIKSIARTRESSSDFDRYLMVAPLTKAALKYRQK